MDHSNIVKTSVKSVTWGIVFQICMRIVTFGLNAYILRYITSDVLGVINVRLMLLYTTIQFISREPFRRAGVSDGKTVRWTEIVSILWLSLPVSVVLGCVLSFVWTSFLHKPDAAAIPGYDFAAFLIVISVAIEMCAEPAHIFGQLHGFVRAKVVMEGILLFVRCFLMAVFIPRFPNEAVSVFAYSLLVAAIIYVFFHYMLLAFRMKPSQLIREFFPRKIKTNWNILLLVWTFGKQTLLKQILTESEKFFMAFFNPLSFAEQGIYDVVNNLSSLPARFIFSPIEEAAYLLFARLIVRNQDPTSQKKVDIELCRNMLHTLLKVMITVGLITIVFGYSFSSLALKLYGGALLSNEQGIKLMRWQSVYILFIAVNGVTETFTFSAMNQEQLDAFNFKMVRLSGVMMISNLIFTRLFGSVGFVIANCLNMGIRILESLLFIRRYFSNTDVKPLSEGLSPSFSVLLVVGLCFPILALSEAKLCCEVYRSVGLHVGIGVLCLAIVAVAIFHTEKQLISFVLSLKKTKSA